MNSQNYFHQYSNVKVQFPVEFVSVYADKSDLRAYIYGYLPITGLILATICLVKKLRYLCEGITALLLPRFERCLPSVVS